MTIREQLRHSVHTIDYIYIYIYTAGMSAGCLKDAYLWMIGKLYILVCGDEFACMDRAAPAVVTRAERSPLVVTKE